MTRPSQERSRSETQLETPPLPFRLQDLPTEVLVRVLAFVDDLPSLANAGLACGSLRDVIFGDDDLVWREMHLIKYDDPRKASAFLIPRTSYDWKGRVLEREAVSKYLRTTKGGRNVIPESKDVKLYGYPQPEWNLDEWIPRITAAAVDLLCDLPAAGVPSANIPILEEWIQSYTFPYICRQRQGAYDFSDISSTGEVNHLGALLSHMSALQPDPSVLFIIQTPFRSTTEVLYSNRKMITWTDTTQWKHVSVRALAVADALEQDSNSAYQALVSDAVRGGLEALRGSGVLGLSRPDGLGSDHVWDWAGVQGHWCSISLLRVDMRGCDLHDILRTVPGAFHLTAVADEDNVVAAYSSMYSRGGNHLWNQFPDLHLSEFPNPLPPIYFHGTVNTKSDAPSIFVYGVVHLTNDSPPELRWNLATENCDNPSANIVIQAVQLGGAGSRKGFIGVRVLPTHKGVQSIPQEYDRLAPSWAYVGYCGDHSTASKYRPNEYDERVKFWDRPEGAVWCWKASEDDVEPPIVDIQNPTADEIVAQVRETYTRPFKGGRPYPSFRLGSMFEGLGSLLSRKKR